MVFCPKCGKEVDNDNNYCIYCGTLIKPVINDLDSKEKPEDNVENEDENKILLKKERINTDVGNEKTDFIPKKVINENVEKVEGTKVFPTKEKQNEQIRYKEPNNQKNSKKKYVFIGIPVIIICLIGIAGVSLFLSHGDFSELPYAFSSNKIDINSVDYIGDYENYDNSYNGAIKEYKVTFTPKEDLHNISIETYAYTKNGTALQPMANFMGLNPLNVLMYKGNATKGSTKTATIVFGNPSGSDFEISYIKVFVYGYDSNDEPVLQSKFTYNL